LSDAGFSPATTRAEALAGLINRFKRSGLGDAGREARLTLEAACRLSPLAVVVAPEAPLGVSAARLEAFAARRANGEPLSRIVGNREFWGLPIALSPDVLDPRPETETIVETVAAFCSGRRLDTLRILDLGVGSGALTCALMREFVNARGLGVDISAAAAAVARRNVEACGFDERAEIRLGRWTEGLDGLFDLIVSNPPYIPTGDIAGLPRSVREFDPRLALDGGIDGLDAYRAILPSAAALLSPGGWLLMEIGAGQAADVFAIAANAGFADCAAQRDLAGVERVLAAPSPRSVQRHRLHEGDSGLEPVSAIG
jgi:release factor glutamine methyltransferase